METKYFLQNKKQELISEFLGKIAELMEIIEKLKKEKIFSGLDELTEVLIKYVGKPQEITHDIAGNLLYI